MQKAELILLHLVLSRMKKIFEVADFSNKHFYSYEELTVRPVSIYRSKAEHKEAILTLCRGISDIFKNIPSEIILENPRLRKSLLYFAGKPRLNLSWIIPSDFHPSILNIPQRQKLGKEERSGLEYDLIPLHGGRHETSIVIKQCPKCGREGRLRSMGKNFKIIHNGTGCCFGWTDKYWEELTNIYNTVRNCPV